MTTTDAKTLPAKAAPQTLSVVARQILMKRFDDVAKALPPQMSDRAEWYIRRACMTLSLAEWPLNVCTASSFAMAVLQGAEVGLPIDGKLGYAVPYKNHKESKRQNQDVYEAKFQPSFVGLTTIAVRSGQIRRIEAELIFENDDFDHGRQDGKVYLTHKFPIGDRGRLLGAYAIVTFPDGGWNYTLMSAQELAEVQATSKASRDDSPWKKWPNEMRKKTVLKRALKLYCADPGYVLASQRDDAAEYEVGEVVAPPRGVGHSQVRIPGVYEPPEPEAAAGPPEAGGDELAAWAEEAVQGDGGPAAASPLAIPHEVEATFEDMCMRLDNADLPGVDVVQRWGLSHVPAAFHGKVAELCNGRRAELQP